MSLKKTSNNLRTSGLVNKSMAFSVLFRRSLSEASFFYLKPLIQDKIKEHKTRKRGQRRKRRKKEKN